MELIKDDVLQVDSINGLTVETQKTITEAFMPFATQFAEWKEKALQIEVNDPSQVDLMKKAGEARKAIKKIRTAADSKKDELKEESNKYNKAVQEVRNRIWKECEEIEAHLEKQEKFKELYEAKVLAERTAARMDRLKEFPEVTSTMIAGMTDEMFEITLTGLITKRDKGIEDARIAEEQRQAAAKAEAERLEAQRIENERLKAEAEAREKQIAEERAKAEAERKAIEDKARKEREAAAAEAKRIQDQKDAELKKEREAREKVEAEMRAKQAEEARIKREKEEKAAAEEKARIAAEKKAAKAPDKAKLTEMINVLSLGVPELKSQESKEVYNDILAKFHAFKDWAGKKIEAL